MAVPFSSQPHMISVLGEGHARLTVDRLIYTGPARARRCPSSLTGSQLERSAVDHAGSPCLHGADGEAAARRIREVQDGLLPGGGRADRCDDHDDGRRDRGLSRTDRLASRADLQLREHLSKKVLDRTWASVMPIDRLRQVCFPDPSGAADHASSCTTAQDERALN